jgi:uncharacterized protein with LGFP repeats
VGGGEIQYFDGGVFGEAAILLPDGADRAVCLYGGVWTKYKIWGGYDSPVGQPVGDVQSVVSSHGTGAQWADFASGRIYAHTSGARAHYAFIVYGPVLSRYPGPQEPFGLPTSDVQENGANPATGTHYDALYGEGGLIVAHRDGANQNKVLLLDGPLAEEYRSLGDVQSALGLPISEKVTQTVMGVRSTSAAFENGVIFRHEDGPQAEEMFVGQGSLWAEWANVGGLETLGLPLGEVEGPLTSSTGTHFRRLRFQNGAIYQHLGGRYPGDTQVVGRRNEVKDHLGNAYDPTVGWDKIWLRYEELGGPSDELGLPESPEFIWTKPDGTKRRRQDFERGYIHWPADNPNYPSPDVFFAPLGETLPRTVFTAQPSEFINVTETTLGWTRWKDAGQSGPEEGTVFRTRLDGGEWSAETSENTVTLTGLTEGPHTFEVLTRNAQGEEDPNPIPFSYFFPSGLILLERTRFLKK